MAGCLEQAARSARQLEGPVLAVALLIAACSARPNAGGWNDGSRLATVESLVDRHTMAIDDSIYVKGLPQGELPGPFPYAPGAGLAFQSGTGDKLFIKGHYYSDKSPVPAILLAAWYQILQWTTGLSAQQRPDLFSYVLTLSSSGLAYALAIWCVFRLACRAGLAPAYCLSLAASLGLGTLALTYCRHVNNHALQLGAMALLMLGLARLADETSKGKTSVALLAGLGMLAGLCYTIDLGAGPVILLCATCLVAYRCPRCASIGTFFLGAIPWLALHHAVNYAVGGTFKPANAVAEYFQWPGCTFNAQNMTGGWNHASVSQFVVYSLALLEGKKGFLGHNLPLYLMFPALFILWKQRGREFPEVVFAFACCAGVWLAYALASNNYSGECCSIRWFVPLLAPGYFIVVQLLRHNNQFMKPFVILSAWGTILGLVMWWKGPWFGRMVPLYWPIHAGAAMTLLLRHNRWRRRSCTIESNLKRAKSGSVRAA
jgi:hypothetical protein